MLKFRKAANETSSVVSKTRSQDVPGLTGLRFVAALSVLLGHSLTLLFNSHQTPEGIITWLERATGFGMTLFFVLSGFVIHYNYAAAVTGTRAAPAIGAFLWARFARLYPLFLLVLFIGVLKDSKPFHMLAGEFKPFHEVIEALPYFLLSIQSWLYIPIGNAALIYAAGGFASLSWSISTEWFFYLVFPGIAWLVTKPGSARLIVVLALVWCVVWMCISISLYDRAPQIDAWAVARFGPVAGMHDNLQDSFVRWLLYFSPYLRIGEFILGTLMAQLYRQLRDRKVTAAENAFGTAMFFTAAASVFLINYLEYSPDVGMNIFRETNMNFALAPSAAVLLLCAARYRNPAVAVLNSGIAIMLGDASYSIYLLHFGILTAIAGVPALSGHGILFDTCKLVIALALIIVISIMVYRYYEAPARRWLRQFWVERPALAVPMSAQNSSL